jgi:hypothetical protein
VNLQENPRIDQSRRRKAAALAVTLLLLFPLQVLANVWLDSFGKQWFYEVRSVPGEVVAGSWSEPSLVVGKTYKLSFHVTKMQGRMALYVGDSPRVVIDRTGDFSVDFKISAGGKKRLVFWTLSSNVVASVSKINLTETDSGPPRGHYLSLSRERDLKREVLDVLADPSSASNWQRTVADGLDAALSTPGVNGFQVTIDWGTIETGDGVYDWQLLDHNMAVAKHYGLVFVVKILDRSFDGSNILPQYFTPSNMLWTTGGGSNAGYVAKRWDPFVYTRIIRLYKAIATRYQNDASFGGIATTESALGSFSGSDYSVEKYAAALNEIMTQTQDALTNGKLFWYLNFIRGGSRADMNKDARVALATAVPRQALVVGGPDVTPDVRGMPGSVSSYRIHVRKLAPELQQFCHLQHVDLGLGMRNVKDNVNRQNYLDQIARVRAQESKPGFNGTPAAFELDDLRTPAGTKVDLHPNWELGNLWTPQELFEFADRNFQCDYFFWNYVDGGSADVFGWPDIKPIIVDTQALYQ